MEIGILLLAAGQSQRFGTDKRRAPLGDHQLMLPCSVANVRSSGLPVVVCLGRDDTDWEAQLTASNIDCIRCPNSMGGMGDTLADGIKRCPTSWQGVLVALADMPWIRPTTFRAVASKLRTDRIVTPEYRGHRGHPVGFGRDFFAQLALLRGDTGARTVLRNTAHAIDKLEIDDPAVCLDVDRPSDITLYPGQHWAHPPG